MKRKIISVVSILLLLCVLTMNAYALEVPDLNHPGSISIAMTYQGEAVPGGTLTLYRVGEVHVENGADYSFRLTQEYTASGIALDDITDPALALALAEYTAANQIAGNKQQIDAEGKITFGDLKLGLYLLVQQDAATGYELASPFLVSVPSRQDLTYIYDVDASPKLSLEPAPTDPPPTTEPTPPDIPQTGQMKWPVPVLAIGGLLLIALGVILHTSGKKKTHEG